VVVSRERSPSVRAAEAGRVGAGGCAAGRRGRPPRRSGAARPASSAKRGAGRDCGSRRPRSGRRSRRAPRARPVGGRVAPPRTAPRTVEEIAVAVVEIAHQQLVEQRAGLVAGLDYPGREEFFRRGPVVARCADDEVMRVCTDPTTADTSVPVPSAVSRLWTGPGDRSAPADIEEVPPTINSTVSNNPVRVQNSSRTRFGRLSSVPPCGVILFAPDFGRNEHATRASGRGHQESG
jgi:hypothetical protein